jgi:hypothetical protein
MRGDAVAQPNYRNNVGISVSVQPHLYRLNSRVPSVHLLL